MMGSFFGIHALAGQYNIGNIDADFKFLGTDFSKLKDSRYEGNMVGVGIAYGYAWPLAEHWNLEAELGLGYVFSFNIKQCQICEKESDKDHHYIGPTKAALNLVYVF